MTTPQTIKVNGFEVPAPVQEIDTQTTHVWKAEPDHPEFFTRWTTAWLGNLSRVHLTKEAAQAHGKALRGIDPSN